MSKLSNTRCAFLFALSIYLLSASLVFANPKEAELNFTYRSNGTLRVNISLDEKVSSRACRIRYRGTVYHENDEAGDLFVTTRGLGSRLLVKGRASSSLRPGRVNGVLPRNGEDAILAVQVSVTCPGQALFLSNVQARFLKCGAGVRRLSGRSFLTQLKQKLEQTS